MALEDYRPTGCIVCTLSPSLLTEMHEGFERGIKYAPIARWLSEEHGIEVAQRQVVSHFANNHHVKKSVGN